MAPLLTRLRAYRNTGTSYVPERGVAAASAVGVVLSTFAVLNKKAVIADGFHKLKLTDHYFGRFVLFIIGTFAAGLFTLGGGWPIDLRSVSGSGIPGVGVAPFLGPFFNSSGLGIPGVGVVPFGNCAPFVGMPGIGLPFIGSGLAERPGGMFAGSRTIA